MTGSPSHDDLQRSTETWMRWGAGLMAVFVLVFPLYRLVEPGTRGDRAEALTAYLADQGEDIYRSECADCHGVDGERGEKAPTLNAAQFLLTTSDERIRTLISVGIPGSDMEAFDLDYGGQLTSEQIEAIATYLRSLEDGSPDLPDWREWEAAP